MVALCGPWFVISEISLLNPCQCLVIVLAHGLSIYVMAICGDMATLWRWCGKLL